MIRVMAETIGIRKEALKDLQTEIFRKSIHMSVALAPWLAQFNKALIINLLLIASFLYLFLEIMRLNGINTGIIKKISLAASRKRDQDSIMMGPVTLAFGAAAVLFCFPLPIAAIGIYALAFGDSVSSIFGKTMGIIKVPFSGGKTLAGSYACFFTVFIICYEISGRFDIAILLGLLACILELIPFKDLDNLFLPIGVSLAAYYLYPYFIMT